MGPELEREQRSSSGQAASRDAAPQQSPAQAPPFPANGATNGAAGLLANGHVSGESTPSEGAPSEAVRGVGAAPKVGKQSQKRKAGAVGEAPGTPGIAAAKAPAKKRQNAGAKATSNGVGSQPGEVGGEGGADPPSVSASADISPAGAADAVQESQVEAVKVAKVVKKGKGAGGKVGAGGVVGKKSSKVVGSLPAAGVRESTRSQKSRTS